MTDKHYWENRARIAEMQLAGKYVCPECLKVRTPSQGKLVPWEATHPTPESPQKDGRVAAEGGAEIDRVVARGDLELAHQYALVLLAKQARELPEKLKQERERVLDAMVEWLAEDDSSLVEIVDVLEFVSTLRGEP